MEVSEVILSAVQEVVNNIKFDSKFEEEIFIGRVYRYLQNDEINYKLLLNIVSKLKWIKKKEINDYFVKYFREKYSVKNLLIDYKMKAKSSSTRLISLISSEGLCNDEQIVGIKSLSDKNIKKYDNIYFIDDYIGSGSTIISAISDSYKFIKNKKIYIVSYACQERAYSNIINSFPSVNFINKIWLSDYKNEFNSDEIDYIDNICSCCPDEKFIYGYNLAGAYVILNKVAPNSDLSMLWYTPMDYNGKSWFNLFDRELSLDILCKKNNELIQKNYIFLKNEFKEIEKKYFITYKEFEFLIYSYSCYYTKEQLIDDGYFDTLEEFEQFIRKLEEKNYVKIKKGYIIIHDQSLYHDIAKIINKLYNNNKKIKKNVTNNF